MNFKFTSRDFKFFILGIFAMFVFVIIYDWSDFVDGFQSGYDRGFNQTTQTDNVE